MMDDLVRLALSDRYLEGVQDQLGAQVARATPAANAQVYVRELTASACQIPSHGPRIAANQSEMTSGRESLIWIQSEQDAYPKIRAGWPPDALERSARHGQIRASVCLGSGQSSMLAWDFDELGVAEPFL